jgi:hypothetical protein
MDRQLARDEMDQARLTFHRLLETATDEDLCRASNGTKWNNEQLLFHMLFGYLIARALLVLVRVFGRLPDRVSKAFARVLNAATTPFHLVNYLGSRGGPRVFGASRMGAKMDRVIAGIQRSLARESDSDLRRGMHYPTNWDPFFEDFMTLADIYRYPTQHFNYHREQLTFGHDRGD